MTATASPPGPHRHPRAAAPARRRRSWSAVRPGTTSTCRSSAASTSATRSSGWSRRSRRPRAAASSTSPPARPPSATPRCSPRPGRTTTCYHAGLAQEGARAGAGRLHVLRGRRRRGHLGVRDGDRQARRALGRARATSPSRPTSTTSRWAGRAATAPPSFGHPLLPARGPGAAAVPDRGGARRAAEVTRVLAALATQPDAGAEQQAEAAGVSARKLPRIANLVVEAGAEGDTVGVDDVRGRAEGYQALQQLPGRHGARLRRDPALPPPVPAGLPRRVRHPALRALRQLPLRRRRRGGRRGRRGRAVALRAPSSGSATRRSATAW